MLGGVLWMADGDATTPWQPSQWRSESVGVRLLAGCRVNVGAALDVEQGHNYTETEDLWMEILKNPGMTLDSQSLKELDTQNPLNDLF